MSDKEHSDGEFYYPEEQKTAERKVVAKNGREKNHRCRHFDKVEASGDTGMKS